MKNDNGVPQTGVSGRTLGARPGYGVTLKKGEDILVSDNGMVKPENGGMSAVPDPIYLNDCRRPKSLGGSGKDPVWEINTNNLGSKLQYVPDRPKNGSDPSKHGTIQPKYPMSYNEYIEALEALQSYWRLIING